MQIPHTVVIKLRVKEKEELHDEIQINVALVSLF
jgi:hypothetical protein